MLSLDLICVDRVLPQSKYFISANDLAYIVRFLCYLDDSFLSFENSEITVVSNLSRFAFDLKGFFLFFLWH